VKYICLSNTTNVFAFGHFIRPARVSLIVSVSFNSRILTESVCVLFHINDIGWLCSKTDALGL